MATLQCQHCGTVVPLEEPIPRDSACAACGNDLRACRNCRHYDPAYNNACRETQADPVGDKSRRNFCEFFYFTRAAFVAATGGASRASDARQKLEALFGGGAPPDRTVDARKKLDALFRKDAAEDDTERE